MAVPVIESSQWTENGAAQTSLTLTAPSGITAGELLLLIVVDDQTAQADYTGPAGWNFVYTHGSSTTDSNSSIWWKKADGTEGNVAVSSTNTNYKGGWYIRISGAEVDRCPINGIRNNSGAGTTATVPWIVTHADDVLGFYVCTGDGADTNPKGTPTDWTEQDEQTAGSTSVGVGASYGTRSLSTGQDTGDRTMSMNSSDGWGTLSFGIVPANATGYICSTDRNDSGDVVATSLNVDFPLTIREGDLCVIHFATDSNLTETSITVPSGWTDIHGEEGNATYDVHLRTFYKYLSSGDISTGYVTVTHTNFYSCALAMHIEGVLVPEDVEAGRSGTTNSAVAATIITTADEDFMLAPCAVDGADANFGASASGYVRTWFTASGSGGVGVSLATFTDLAGTAGATGNKTFSNGTSDGWVSNHIAFKSLSKLATPPAIAASSHNDNSSTTATSLSITAPSGIAAGDLLVVAGHVDTSSEPVLSLTQSGWSKLGQIGDATYDACTGVWWKIADGTEGAVTFNSTINAYIAGQYHRITGHDPFNPIGNWSSDEDTGDLTIAGISTSGPANLMLLMVGGDGGDTHPYSSDDSTLIFTDQTHASTVGVGYAAFERNHYDGGTTESFDLNDASADGNAWFLLSINAGEHAFPNNWQRKCKMTVANGKVAGSTNLTNFPALITQNDLPDEVLDSDISTAPQSNGYDIRFTTGEDGSGPIPHERVHFTQDSTPANAEAEFWVLIPDLDDGTDTDIYMWWDTVETATVDPTAPETVFAAYEFVSHDGGANDVTGNFGAADATGGTPNNSTSHLDFLRAKNFDGTPEYYDHGQTTGSDLGASDRSIQIWARPRDDGSAMNGRAIFIRDSSPDEAIMLIHAEEGTSPTWYAIAGPVVANAVSTTGLRNTVGSYATWQYITATFDAGAAPAAADVYVDTDYNSTSEPADGWGTGNTSTDFWIGARNDSAGGWDGRLSEIRIIKDIITQDWHTTEHNNQQDDGTFWTAGTPSAAQGVSIATSNVETAVVDTVYTGYVHIQSTFPDAWGWKSSITIDNTKVGGTANLTDFPLLITDNDLPADMLDADGTDPAQSDGGDIRFTTDSNGTNEIPCEIVLWNLNDNPALSTAVIWVKVPTVDYNDDTTIYIWWGTDKTEKQYPDGHPLHYYTVWEDYEFVWHNSATNFGTGSETDATGKHVFGKTGTPVTTTGPFGHTGQGDDHPGTDDYYRIDPTGGGFDFYSGGSWTLQAWAKPDTGATSDWVATVQNPSTAGGGTVGGFAIGLSSGGEWVACGGPAASWTLNKKGGTFTTDTWALIHGTIINILGIVDVIVDGVSNTTAHTQTWNTGGVMNDAFTIGASSYSSGPVHDWVGDSAEVRLRNWDVTTGWALTEYNNQVNDGTFMDISDPQNQDVTPIVASDSWTISFSFENVGNVVTSSIPDALDIGLTEVDTNAITSNLTDDLDISISDLTTILVTLLREDDLDLSLSDITAIIVSVALGDNLDISLTDVQTLFMGILVNVTDTLDISITENSPIFKYLIAVFDYLQIDFPDKDYTWEEVEALREDDDINALFRFAYQADDLTIGDFETYATDPFGWTEVTAIAVNAVTYIIGADDLDVSITEAVDLLNSFIRLDDLDVSLTEQVINVLTSSRDDTLAVSIAESTLNVLRSTRMDDLDVSVIAQTLILTTLARTDQLDVSIDDLTSILVTLARTDTFNMSLTELVTMQKFIQRTDTLSTSLVDAINIVVRSARSDALDLTITETIALLNRFATSDVLSVAFDDLANLLWATLEAYRWRDDDDDEASAAWLAGENTAINRAKALNTRLRVLLDTSSDTEALQLTLQYRRVGDPDWEWRDVE